MPGARKCRRWWLIVLAAILIIILGIGGGSYLWLDRVVQGANERLDEEVREEIEEAIQTKPSSPLVSVPEPPDSIGVSATTWTDAPLAGPGSTFEAGGTTYTIVYSGSEVERIWWKTDGILYFISNTLFRDLDPDEMMSMAKSMGRLPGFTTG